MFGKANGTIPSKEGPELCVKFRVLMCLDHDFVFSGGSEVPPSNHGSERS